MNEKEFNRPKIKKALPVMVHFEKEDHAPEEFLKLIKSANYNIEESVRSKLSKIDAKTFLGKGLVEQTYMLSKELTVDVVLINKNISASQQRNLRKSLKCDVLDWTGLILEIFSLRARSFEGRMQVELAQLRYLSTRLIRGWTHLERQKGGHGLRGGPGETQLEIDRRLLTIRIRQVKERLVKIKKQRELSGGARRRGGIPTVALVGYTNAGKSTLFNKLTNHQVYAADQLFATLDTTTRLLSTNGSEKIVVSDTVGFIKNLPPTLVAAFRATLEETAQAQLLLHVVDISDSAHLEQMEEVEKVLDQIGAAKIPTIIVYNKIDNCVNKPAIIDRNANGDIHSVGISAVSGQGLNELITTIEEKISGKKQFLTLRLEASQGKLRSLLYDWRAVSDETILENGDFLIRLGLTRKELRILGQKSGLEDFAL